MTDMFHACHLFPMTSDKEFTFHIDNKYPFDANVDRYFDVRDSSVGCVYKDDNLHFMYSEKVTHVVHSSAGNVHHPDYYQVSYYDVKFLAKPLLYECDGSGHPSYDREKLVWSTPMKRFRISFYEGTNIPADYYALPSISDSDRWYHQIKIGNLLTVGRNRWPPIKGFRSTAQTIGVAHHKRLTKSQLAKRILDWHHAEASKNPEQYLKRIPRSTVSGMNDTLPDPSSDDVDAMST